MSRRVLAGTAIGGVLILAVAGCSGKQGTGAEAFNPSGSGAQSGQGLTAAALVGQVAQQTDKVDTFKVTTSMSMDMSGLGQMTMHATGQMRLRPHIAMAMDIDSINAGAMNIPGGMREVLVDDTLYLKMPQLARQTGKPWVKMSLKDLGSRAGLNLSQLMGQASQSNPADQVKKLLASKDIHKVGSEVIGGVQTVHYAGSVSAAEAMAQADPRLRELGKIDEAAGVTSTDYDLWVGPDSLPRQIIAKTATAHGPVSLTVTYSDYGAPVSISAPPAGQVGEMPSLPMPKAPTAPPAGI